MGLLRRPTPGEIVEADDCAGPAGRARIRAQLDKTRLRLRRPFGHCLKSHDVGDRMVRCSANPSPGRPPSSWPGRRPGSGSAAPPPAGLEPGVVPAWGSSLLNSAPRSTSSRARTSSSRSQHSRHRPRPPGRPAGRSPLGPRTRPAAPLVDPGGVAAGPAGGPGPAGHDGRPPGRWPALLGGAAADVPVGGPGRRDGQGRGPVGAWAGRWRCWVITITPGHGRPASA